VFPKDPPEKNIKGGKKRDIGKKLQSI